MSWTDFERPLVIIVGPTAVGKTSMAIELGELLSGEVVSADSRYFYRGMNIGTAKPTVKEMRNVIHHLIDISEPDETWSIARFQSEARTAIAAIHQRGNLPLLVGGTGQYVRALLDEWNLPTQERDDHLREVLEHEVKKAGRDILYAFLEKVDPEAAAHIDPRNKRRTLRAVEVILRTGRLFSAGRGISESPYTRKMIGLTCDRMTLYQRIDERINAMIENGLIEEVEVLLAQGVSPKYSSMSAIGYREISQYLNGGISLPDAIVLMKRNTRKFIRRQANWFKLNDPSIKWFDVINLSKYEIADYIQSDLGWTSCGE